MVELGTRLAYRKSEGRKLSTYGCARRISTRRRRLPASAPASLPLSAAPEAQRSAAPDRECFSRPTIGLPWCLSRDTRVKQGDHHATPCRWAPRPPRPRLPCGAACSRGAAVGERPPDRAPQPLFPCHGGSHGGPLHGGHLPPGVTGFGLY